MQHFLPVFPLPNVVLFPGGLLSLHIFEPRYKAMIRAALKSDKTIGMVLLKDGWEANYHGDAAVEAIGCAGLIEVYEKLPAGRFNILLRGTTRFAVEKLCPTQCWRSAEVVFLPEKDFPYTDAEKGRLYRHMREKIVAYFGTVLCHTSTLHRMMLAEQDPGILLNRAIMLLDIDVRTRYELLQLDELEKRYTFFVHIIDERLKTRVLAHGLKNIPFDEHTN